jgi:hypothetical protein
MNPDSNTDITVAISHRKVFIKTENCTCLNWIGISDGGSPEVNAADPGFPQATRQHHSSPAIRQGSFSLLFLFGIVL